MAQSFPEKAHLNIDREKFRENWDSIDWGKKYIGVDIAVGPERCFINGVEVDCEEAAKIAQDSEDA